MRRKPTMAILILVSIILQSTVCPDDIDCVDQAESAHYPDSFFWPDAREKSGMLTDFFCGLLTDIFQQHHWFQCADLSLGWVFQRIFLSHFYDDDIRHHCF